MNARTMKVINGLEETMAAKGMAKTVSPKIDLANRATTQQTALNDTNVPSKVIDEPMAVIKTDALLSKLVDEILNKTEPTNFLDYAEKMGGNRKIYEITKNIDGKEVKQSKLKPDHLAVIGWNHTKELLNSLGYSIKQLRSDDGESKMAYLFNGKYWQPINDGFIRSLVNKVLIAMGCDIVEAQTAYVNEKIIKTIWFNIYCINLKAVLDYVELSQNYH